MNNFTTAVRQSNFRKVVLINNQIAAVRRFKGVINNQESSKRRRIDFIKSFNDWPLILTPSEMTQRIQDWLKDPVRRKFNAKEGRWVWKSKVKNNAKKVVSVRNKITKLGVYSYSFRWGYWTKFTNAEVNELNKPITKCPVENKILTKKAKKRIRSEQASDKFKGLGFFKKRCRRIKAIYGGKYKSDITPLALMYIWYKQRGLCPYTRQKMTRFDAHIDHIIPISRGGEHKPSNMQWLPSKINFMKSNLMHDEFIRECVAVYYHSAR